MDMIVSTTSSTSPVHGVKWDDHLRNVFTQDRLSDLKQSNKLVDVVLEATSPTDGTKMEISAHKLVLALASPYFWDYFVDSTSSNPRVRVPLIEPIALDAIIKFIYTGRLEVTEELVQNLFVAAQLLQVTVVQTRCEDYMIANIDKDNCGHRLEFARAQNCEELFHAVVNFISGNYAEFLKSPDFLKLQIKEVVTVLQTPGRLQTPEEAIFTSVLAWLNHDKDGRVRHSATLLKEIDLGQLPEDFLHFHFDTQKALHSYDSLMYFQNFLKSVELKKAEGNESNKNSGKKNVPKSVVSTTVEDERIYHVPSKALQPALPNVTNKSSSRHASKELEVFRATSPVVMMSDIYDNEEEEDGDDDGGPQRKKRRIGDASSSSGRKEKDSDKIPPTNSNPIEVSKPKPKAVARKHTGGQSKDYYHPPTSRIENNNNDADKNKSNNEQVSNGLSVTPITIKYGSRHPEQQNNADHYSKDVKNKSDKHEVILYLRQGKTKNENRIMMHDLIMSKPKKLRNFSYSIKSSTLLWVKERKRLYSLGGVKSVWQEQGSTKEVRYTSEEDLTDPKCKRKNWTTDSAMIQERNNFTAVELKGYIYSFGGSEGILGNQAVNCAERLSLAPLPPSSKKKKREWEDTDYLQRARQGFGAAVLHGKIYVAGGYGALDDLKICTMGILNTVEVYDPEKDEWKYASTMSSERHGLALVAFHGLLYAIGGGGSQSHVSFKDDIKTMKSVEVYNPVKDRWTRIASMNRPRKNFSAAVLNGKLYAIAGDYSNGEKEKAVSSVEVYDPEEDKWTLVLDSIDDRGDFTSIAVWKSSGIF